MAVVMGVQALKIVLYNVLRIFIADLLCNMHNRQQIEAGGVRALQISPKLY